MALKPNGPEANPLARNFSTKCTGKHPARPTRSALRIPARRAPPVFQALLWPRQSLPPPEDCAVPASLARRGLVAGKCRRQENAGPPWSRPRSSATRWLATLHRGDTAAHDGLARYIGCRARPSLLLPTADTTPMERIDGQAEELGFPAGSPRRGCCRRRPRTVSRRG